MKKIVIPGNVALKLQDRVVDYSFHQYVVENVLADEKFGVNHRTLKSALSIESRVMKVRAGDELVLDESEWQLLAAAVAEPTRPFVVVVVKQLVAFLDAILEAKEV